mmetsp:Transcript_13430/g.20391  ORF Transcript_13430/g.20391 Transcript_13430/m.20391 type:complete len:112 (-) Transcript_13430:237-572(-)
MCVRKRVCACMCLCVVGVYLRLGLTGGVSKLAFLFEMSGTQSIEISQKTFLSCNKLVLSSIYKYKYFGWLGWMEWCKFKENEKYLIFSPKKQNVARKIFFTAFSSFFFWSV